MPYYIGGELMTTRQKIQAGMAGPIVVSLRQYLVGGGWIWNTFSCDTAEEVDELIVNRKKEDYIITE